MDTYLKRYFDYLKFEKQLSTNTLVSYERDLNLLSAYLEEQGIRSYNDVERTHLAKYLIHMKEQGRKAATISRHIVSAKAFFQYLTVHSLIRQDPTIQISSPKQVKREPNILSIATTNQLLSTPKGDTVAGVRDKAMLELLYATGIRVTELVSLDISHLNLAMGFIQCAYGSMKERVIPIGRPASEALDTYLESTRGKLLTHREAGQALFLNHLGTRMTRQGFWKMMKKTAKQANIVEELTPHTLRHSVAAHLLDNGADIRIVQELLGHTDMASTLKYSQIPKVRLKDAYVGAHPRA